MASNRETGWQKLRQAKARAANPGRPWMWREDFASGVLHPEGARGTVFAAVFLIVWNAFAMLGAWAAIREYQQRGDPRMLVVLAFPAAGLLVLRWSIRQLRPWLRYRGAVLRLEDTPVEIGGWLKGAVLIPRRLDPDQGFDLTLSCLRRRRGSDSDTHDVLWEERAHVPGPAGSWPEAATAIPVSMAIPAECEPWDEDTPERRVIWQLRVTAEVPGGGLDQAFPVPVFRTHPEDPSRPRERLPDGFIRAPEHAPAPASFRGRIEAAAEGAEFVFPPAGGLKSLLGFLIVAAVTAGIASGISTAGAPVIFPLAIGVFGLIPAFAFLWSAAGEVRVLIGSQTVKVTYSAPGFRKSWIAAAADVLEAGISVPQSGRRPSYAILLRRRNARPLCVLAMLGDKGEAEWVASEMNRRLRR